MNARFFALPSLLALLLLPGVTLTNAIAQTDEGLGRLFFTPEKRQLLDRQRELNIQAQQETPDNPTLTINGMVTRSSGKQTVWLNEVPQHERQATTGITVRQDKRHPGQVVLRQLEGPQTEAKIGASINRSTGAATDVLGGGRIVRKVVPAP